MGRNGFGAHVRVRVVGDISVGEIQRTSPPCRRVRYVGEGPLAAVVVLLVTDLRRATRGERVRLAVGVIAVTKLYPNRSHVEVVQAIRGCFSGRTG